MADPSVTRALSSFKLLLVAIDFYSSPRCS
jgi:hypothetical protein